MSTRPARFLVLWEKPTDTEAFERHYREVHVPLVRKLPGLRSYSITANPDPVRGEPYHWIAELRWDTMDDLRAGFASPEAAAVGADVANLEEWSVCRSMILGTPEELL